MRERRSPRVARFPVSATFWLGASEPETNALRVTFIAQLFAFIFERLMCTTTLLNAWCVLRCLVPSPWGGVMFHVLETSPPRFSEAT